MTQIMLEIMNLMSMMIVFMFKKSTFSAENAQLDFETEPEIALVITAARSGPHASVKELLLIEVLDVPEQPQSISLTNQTVLENTYGAVVGQVLVDGGPASSQFLVSVNDSRFEVANGILKLRDQVLVERDSQTEIEVMLGVSDQSGIFESISSAFVLHVAENANPYHNADNPYDVDRNGSVTALDALGNHQLPECVWSRSYSANGWGLRLRRQCRQASHFTRCIVSPE